MSTKADSPNTPAASGVPLRKTPDSEAIERAVQAMAAGDMEAYLRLAHKPGVPPGEISPALRPRIEEHGLERHCKELWEQGYTVVEDVASPEFWTNLRESILAMGTQYSPLLEEHPALAQAVLLPKLMALAEFSVGAGFQLSNAAGTVMNPGDHFIELHCDQGYMPAPFPEHNQFLTCCFACTDYTAESGATVVVLGSQKLRRPPTYDEVREAEGAVPIVCRAGSVAVWDGRIWHASGTRTIEGQRVVLHVSYTRMTIQPIVSYAASAARLIELYGDDMAQLMGAYNLFGTPVGTTQGDDHDVRKLLTTTLESQR